MTNTWFTAEVVAYHEAGHAVLRHLFGDTTYITIAGVYDGPDESEFIGLCSGSEIPSFSRKTLVRQGCVRLAGFVAEGLIDGREPSHPPLKDLLDWCEEERGKPGTPSDSVQVFDTVQRLGPSREQWEPIYGEIARLTERLLRRRWREVEAIATGLLERVTLSSEEIQKLLGRSGGSVRRQRRAADRAEDVAIRAELYELSGDRHDVIGP